MLIWQDRGGNRGQWKIWVKVIQNGVFSLRLLFFNTGGLQDEKVDQ